MMIEQQAPARHADRKGLENSSHQSCCWGLNPGPRPYQGRALPLSYSSTLRESTLRERATGLEPATSSLEGWSSTIELHPRAEVRRIQRIAKLPALSILHPSAFILTRVGREGFEPP